MRVIWKGFWRVAIILRLNDRKKERAVSGSGVESNHGVGSGDHLLHLGADLRQLSRLTGVSFGVIQKL